MRFEPLRLGRLLYCRKSLPFVEDVIKLAKGVVHTNVKLALDSLENLVLSSKEDSQIERLKAYGAIKAIVSELGEAAKAAHAPNYHEYQHKLLWSYESICGLGDGNGHSDSEHRTWALGEINKMRSVHCFNLE